MYSVDELKSAIATSGTYFEVLTKLGAKTTSAAYLKLQKEIIQKKLNAQHLVRKSPYSQEELRAAVKSTSSLESVAKAFGKHESYAKYVLFDIRRWAIDISHFTGRQHLRMTHDELSYAKTPLDLVLTNQYQMKTSHLKKRLFDEGLKARSCEHCGLSEYAGSPIPFELNHVNGDCNDNRLSNLEVVDPNCHSLTSTFAGRNSSLRKRYTIDELRAAAARSPNMRATMRALGFTDYQEAAAARIREDIAKNAIPIDHWKNGQGYRGSRQYARPLSELLVYGSKIKSASLKERLFREGLKDRCCEECGVRDWNGQKLAFTIDHINGDNRDNRLTNLRILCFICHARTPTYKGKNISLRRQLSLATGYACGDIADFLSL